MIDELELMQLLATGEQLAEVDGTHYTAIHLVYAVPPDDAPNLHCRRAEWETTPASRLAQRDRQIADLSTALDQMTAQAVQECQRAEAALARVAELERQLAATTPPPTADDEVAPFHSGGQDKRIECAICRHKIWPSKFDAHMAKHTRLDGTPTPPPTPALLALVEAPFVCVQCEREGRPTTHARSLADPSRCFKCAHARSEEHTNGQLVAA